MRMQLSLRSMELKVCSKISFPRIKFLQIVTESLWIGIKYRIAFNIYFKLYINTSFLKAESSRTVNNKIKFQYHPKLIDDCLIRINSLSLHSIRNDKLDFHTIITSL